MQLFAFDPHAYAAQFAANGFVHIRGGLTDEYYSRLCRQVEEYSQQHLKDFALGDKQQSLYEFPQGLCDLQDLFDAVGRVCGLDSQAMVLSERHIKVYDAQAAPKPLAHKDRFASEISIGFSVKVSPGSTLVLYPYDVLDINPFNSSAELRSSFRADNKPEARLKHARRVEIQDAARDVMMFRGNAIWHTREQGAGTTMVYLKLNTFNSDPIGEDPRAGDALQQSLDLARLPDEELRQFIPRLGRRVDHYGIRYNHCGQEVCGVVLWHQPFLTVEPGEFAVLRSLDGRRNVARIVQAARQCGDVSLGLNEIRKLASLGMIDLSRPAELSIAAPACESDCAETLAAVPIAGG